MTDQMRTGSTRVGVPASIRNGRRNRGVVAGIAGAAIVAFAAVGLAQPFIAATPSQAAAAPSLAQISAAQPQQYQANLVSAANGADTKTQVASAELVTRGDEIKTELKPEPKPAAPAAPASQTGDSSASSGSQQSTSYPKGQSYDAGTVQGIAQQVLAEAGMADQWGCFEAIIGQESGWDPYATNPSSGAYGIPQALPGSKMSSAGDDWQTNPATQIRWAVGYMNGRYGSPCGAYDFKFTQGNGWY